MALAVVWVQTKVCPRLAGGDGASRRVKRESAPARDASRRVFCPASECVVNRRGRTKVVPEKVWPRAPVHTPRWFWLDHWSTGSLDGCSADATRNLYQRRFTNLKTTRRSRNGATNVLVVFGSRDSYRVLIYYLLSEISYCECLSIVITVYS